MKEKNLRRRRCSCDLLIMEPGCCEGLKAPKCSALCCKRRLESLIKSNCDRNLSRLFQSVLKEFRCFYRILLIPAQTAASRVSRSTLISVLPASSARCSTRVNCLSVVFRNLKDNYISVISELLSDILMWSSMGTDSPPADVLGTLSLTFGLSAQTASWSVTELLDC